MQSQTVAKKRMSTRTLMLLTGVLTITLGFSLTIGLLSWQSSQQQKKLAEDYLGQIAQSQALSVQKELEYARTVAAAMGQSLIALPAAGITDRAQAEQIMVYALKMNPSYLSMSAVLEPNVLDGRDAEFASQPGSPPGGASRAMSIGIKRVPIKAI